MRNVDKLISKLLGKLAWAPDFKLKEMAHRQELKFTMNYNDGGCVHTRAAVEKHRCIQFSLRIPCSSSEAVTTEQLEKKMGDLLKCSLPYCETCDSRVPRTGFLSIHPGCDSDFLTIVCDAPICFTGSEFSIAFSRSKYRLMTVLHWDLKNRKSSVSKEKEDGWHWYGIDEGQAESYKYSPAQVEASRHMQDSAVLMMVRMEDDEDISATGAAAEGIVQVGETCEGDAAKGLGGESGEVNQQDSERGQVSSTAADQFQRDTERAKALSRDVNPSSLADLLSKGVAFAAWNLGILCRRPEIFIELDGNCIWISVCHAMDPTLRGADLQQAAWELRVKALGTVIARFEQLSADEVIWLQAVSVKEKQMNPSTKEEIKSKLQSYLKGGEWSGELGDIIPQVVASFTRRALMIIDMSYAGKTTLNIVRPGVIFDCGGEEENACPLMLVLQLNHFVPLHIAQCAQETAVEKYKLWKTSENVNLGIEASMEGNSNFHPPVRTSEENSAAAEEDEMEVDVDAEQGGVGQDDQRSAGLRGVAAANEDNLDVDGQGEEVNFHPPRTSTQRDESHWTGAGDATSGDGGKRSNFSEREDAGNDGWTQV